METKKSIPSIVKFGFTRNVWKRLSGYDADGRLFLPSIWYRTFNEARTAFICEKWCHAAALILGDWSNHHHKTFGSDLFFIRIGIALKIFEVMSCAAVQLQNSFPAATWTQEAHVYSPKVAIRKFEIFEAAMYVLLKDTCMTIQSSVLRYLGEIKGGFASEPSGFPDSIAPLMQSLYAGHKAGNPQHEWNRVGQAILSRPSLTSASNHGTISTQHGNFPIAALTCWSYHLPATSWKTGVAKPFIQTKDWCCW